MERSQLSSTEFDIVRVKPHVDLVLFDNVISCYSSDRDITANYVLGQDVTSTSWDWVGIFPTDWRYLSEYLAYRWSQARAPDCTAPLRRNIVFPRHVHQIPSSYRHTYQLLYVSRGNHVVGVSSPFRVFDEPELDQYNIDTLFNPDSTVCETEASSSNKSRTRKAIAPLEDSYEVVNELICPSVPKRRTQRKDKVTTVYRDNHTLVNIPNFQDWAEKLRCIQVGGVVQEYGTSTALLPYKPMELIPVYNIKWSGIGTSTASPSTSGAQQLSLMYPCLPSIEYPEIRPIKPGPMSFLGMMKYNCSGCKVAKTIVLDLVEKEALLENKLVLMKVQMSKLKHEEKTTSTTSTVGLLDWAIGQLQTDNKALSMRIDDLEEKLAEARGKEERRQAECEEDNGTWMIREPKRIVRLKNVIGRQSSSVATLRQCNEYRQRQVLRLLGENSRMRKLVKSAFETSNRFRELSEDITKRLRSVLAERAKDHTNEWRRFARQVQENTTQTSDVSSTSGSGNYSDNTASQSSSKRAPRQPVKNKQISKLLKSERHHKSRLHKEMSEAEQCPTCGLKFSRKADRRVIEEHLVFHDRMNC